MTTSDDGVESCPACGALPCDWVWNPRTDAESELTGLRLRAETAERERDALRAGVDEARRQIVAAKNRWATRTNHRLNDRMEYGLTQALAILDQHLSPAALLAFLAARAA